MTIVKSNYDRQPLDLYETEAWATQALLRNFSMKGKKVWEPAAGNHKIADVIRDTADDVITSDIVTYTRPHDFETDFFNPRSALKYFAKAVKDADAIVTNPPFGWHNMDAVKFAELSLERCDGLVALLLQAKFDFGKTRVHLFRDNPRFCAKIALLDRIQWFPGPTGTEDHAWYVWRPTTNQVRPPMTLYEGRKA